MLKINCPVCGKSFIWTDDMATQGQCKHCDWQYDIQSELKKNVARHENVVIAKKLQCPSCAAEIKSRMTICPGCGCIVWGEKAFKKSYIFVAVCLVLIILSLIYKYGIK